VRRTNYIKLVTNELVIDEINKIAINKEHQAALPAAEIGEQTEDLQEETQVEAGQELLQEIQPSTQQDTNQNNLPDNPTEIQQETTDDVEDEGMEVTQDVAQEAGHEVKRPSRFMAVTKAIHEEWKSEENVKAINAEIKILFEDLKALRPVKRASIKGGTKVLRSHMFVVEKFLVIGEFDKMKARLVADGRDQESNMYLDKASPTVALHSVFTILGIMATKKWLQVAKVDVKGAFVQTPMEGQDVFMKIDRKITKYVVDMYPKLKEFMEEDGCIYTVMLKAMYGCVQASSFWYKFLKKSLEELGYERSEMDKCILRKKIGEKIFILLVYVDDILAFVDKDEVERLRKFLNQRFGKVQFVVRNKHSYLGMQISIMGSGIMVDMV
jgi:hypothetical protein